MKNRNIWGYFIIMSMVFYFIISLVSLLPSVLLDVLQYYKYGGEFLSELIFILIILIVLLKMKKNYVFTQKKENFKHSIKIGLSVLALSIGLLLNNIFKLDGFSIPNFINLTLLSFSIGIAEEFLCRGWIQNSFIEKFGKTRKQVLLSIFLSSLIFGGMHLSNIMFGQTIFETIIQVGQTTAAGFLLGAIYYRTKNIWAVSFLHGFYDFCVMLPELNSLKDCTSNNPTMEVAIFYFIMSGILIIYYILSSMLLLRKSKMTDLLENNEEMSDVNLQKEKYITKFLYIGIIVSLLIAILPIKVNIKGAEEYETCYHYETKEINDMNYETHYPHVEVAAINYHKEIIITNDNENHDSIMNFEPVIYYEDINLEIYLKDEFTLELKNTNTNDVVEIISGNIYEYEVVENNEDYSILVHCFDDNMTESIIYYTKISKDNLENSKSLLDSIKNSFVEFKLPLIDQIGYLTLENDPQKIPLMMSELYDKFVITEEGKLQVWNFNY